MKDIEKAHIMIANLVFAGLSVTQMDKIPKWLLENIEKNIPSFMDTLLETQALALEGMKPDERTTAIFGEWVAESYEDKMLVSAALQHAADHLRAQKI